MIKQTNKDRFERKAERIIMRSFLLPVQKVILAVMADDYKFRRKVNDAGKVINHYNAGSKELAKETGQSERTVRDNISKLKSLGLIEVVSSKEGNSDWVDVMHCPEQLDLFFSLQEPPLKPWRDLELPFSPSDQGLEDTDNIFDWLDQDDITETEDESLFVETKRSLLKATPKVTETPIVPRAVPRVQAPAMPEPEPNPSHSYISESGEYVDEGEWY